MEIRDGKKYQVIKEGTYATIKCFDESYIKIMIQLCQYEYGNLIGIKDIEIARYKIYNISDDKPKFIIRRINELKYGDLGSDKRFKQKIVAEKKVVYVTPSSDYFNYKAYINSNFDVGSGISCSLIYDPRSMEYISAYPSDCCESNSEGWLKLKFDNTRRIDTMTFQVTDYGKKQRIGNPNAMVVLDVFDPKGMKMETENGYVTYARGEGQLQVTFFDTIGRSVISVVYAQIGDRITAPIAPPH